MKLINTNPSFGMEGPYEVESRDSFVKEMDVAFYEMAKEWFNSLSFEERDSLPEADDPIESKVSEIRAEFCKGLEEFKEDLFTETEKADIEEVMRRR